MGYKSFRELKFAMLIKCEKGPEHLKNTVFAVFEFRVKVKNVPSYSPSTDDVFISNLVEGIQRYVDGCDIHGIESLRNNLKALCEKQGWKMEQLNIWDLYLGRDPGLMASSSH